MLLSENTTTWPEEIVNNFFDKFPLLEKYGASFKNLEFDESAKNLIAMINIIPLKVGFFVVVRNGDLLPFDVAYKDKKIVLISPENITDVLVDKNYADGGVKKIDEQSAYNNIDVNSLSNILNPVTFKISSDKFLKTVEKNLTPQLNDAQYNTLNALVEKIAKCSFGTKEKKYDFYHNTSKGLFKIASDGSSEPVTDDDELDSDRLKAITKNEGTKTPIVSLKIIRITKGNSVDNPEIETPSGAQVQDSDGGILEGLIRKLFCISSLAGNPVKRTIGMGFLGNDGTFSDIGKGIQGKMSDEPSVGEDDLENVKNITPGSKIVIISDSDMSEPMKLLGMNRTGEPMTKTDEGDIITVKKNDKIKKACYYQNILYVPENYKFASVSSKSRVYPLKEAFVCETPFLVDEWNKITKESSKKSKIVIYIEKTGSMYKVSAQFKGSGKVLMKTENSTGEEELKETLISLGLSPMRAGNISRNIAKADGNIAFSIEAETDVEDTDYNIKKSKLTAHERENLIDVAIKIAEDARHVNSAARVFGSSVIDMGSDEELRKMIPEIKKTKDYLSEFALVQKIKGNQDNVDKVVDAISALNKLESVTFI